MGQPNPSRETKISGANGEGKKKRPREGISTHSQLIDAPHVHQVLDLRTYTIDEYWKVALNTLRVIFLLIFTDN